MKLELSGAQRDQLMQSYLGLKAWPDVAPGLKKMRDAGIRMAFLSNFTAEMLEAAVRNSGLQGMFEDHLTTDRVKAFKPDPRAYQMGVDAFGMKKEEIAFAAFAGWDVAGAKWYGYPTFWVNRAERAARRTWCCAGRHRHGSERSRVLCGIVAAILLYRPPIIPPP